jgi:hypothetical protein
MEMRALIRFSTWLSFLAMAIVGLSASAYPMKLLGIDLEEADVAFLYSLKDMTKAPEIAEKFAAKYPEVRLEQSNQIPGGGEYINAFRDGADFSERPILKYDSDASKVVIVHEALHYFIDRARLQKWHVETVDQRRSFFTWRREESKTLDKLLDVALEKGDATGEALAMAEIILSTAEYLLEGDGQEAEVSIFLLKNRKLLGLSDQDLIGQHRHAVLSLGQLTPEFESILEDATRHLTASIRVARAHKPRMDKIGDRFQELYQAVQSQGAYLRGTDCQQLLTGWRGK